MSTPSCGKHGKALMPDGTCYDCTLEGHATEGAEQAQEDEGQIPEGEEGEAGEDGEVLPNFPPRRHKKK